MNKVNYFGLLLLVISLLLFSQCKNQTTPKLGKDPSKTVVAAMTLAEKAYFVTGTGMDVPSAKNFPGIVLQPEKQQAGADEQDMLAAFMHPKPSRIVYGEGIYVGYRYYDTFKIAPAYEFGFGLSYTKFEYSNLSLNAEKFSDKITATVDVKNSGKVAGKEVVQLYLSAPADKLDKPIAELKGFAKTRLLQPGESQNLKFEISARNLASFDPASSSWVAEAGRYTVKIGASSRDIRQTASFDLDRELIVKKESIALVPKVRIDELKPTSRSGLK